MRGDAVLAELTRNCPPRRSAQQDAALTAGTPRNRCTTDQIADQETAAMPRPYRPIDPARVQQLAEGRAAARQHMIDLIAQDRRELANAATEQERADAFGRLLYHEFDLEALDAGVMQSEYLLRELTRLLRLGATIMAGAPDDMVLVYRMSVGVDRETKYVCATRSSRPHNYFVWYKSPRHAAQAMASLTTPERIRVGIEAHRMAYPQHKPVAPAQETPDAQG